LRHLGATLTHEDICSIHIAQLGALLLFTLFPPITPMDGHRVSSPSRPTPHLGSLSYHPVAEGRKGLLRTPEPLVEEVRSERLRKFTWKVYRDPYRHSTTAGPSAGKPAVGLGLAPSTVGISVGRSAAVVGQAPSSVGRLAGKFVG
jgi:hypothetical protein